jgi:ATP adenylyltransferase
VPLDQLWATWRSLYVTGDPQTRRALPGQHPEPLSQDGNPHSLFERILNCGASDSETLILHRGAECFVILNRFPYTSGHLMVLPNRAVADLEDLEQSEFDELWSLVRQGVSALKSTLNCDGVNVGINLGRAAGGSQTDHLHVHCVPRWIGDANFMATVGGSQVMPVALEDVWQALQPFWTASDAQPDSAGTAPVATVEP